MGFPVRPTRSTFGPDLENERRVENPRREIGAETFTLAWWQLAGMGRTSERVTLVGRWDGLAMQTDYQAFAWDPNGQLPLLIPTRLGVGEYRVVFAATYPDEAGAQRPIELKAHAAHPQPSALGGPFIAQTRRISATEIEIKVWDASGAGAPVLADVPFLLLVW
jgi:hypothetical protein